MTKTICFRLMLTLSLMARWLDGNAQNHVAYSPNIATIQVTAGGDWLSPPIIVLGGQTAIHISFDDLTHEYKRYTYAIEHCEADWTTSKGLFPGDYLSGFRTGMTIDQLEESLNTNTLYTHYQLEIPNNECQIKMSGNYRLTVFDESHDNQPVLSVCFMVVEPQVGIQLDVTTNCDTDINNKHQQVSMTVNYGQLTVSDPSTQLKTVVMQNYSWQSARKNLQPQVILPAGLRWEHNRNLIFEAGNEYRKFEMLNAHVASIGIEKIVWDGTDFNVMLYPDEVCYNYIYDEDANGSFFIRNSDYTEMEKTTDYMKVHFTLQIPQITGKIYVDGAWTNEQKDEKYEMVYNTETKAYELCLHLKQGYYSYRYLWEERPGRIRNLPTEGNFYQTENEYQALVYFKGHADRADRLVGYQQVQFK